MKDFEWDQNKNEKNKMKHRVSFEDAQEVFTDEYGIEKVSTNTEEARFLRIGKTATKLILLVVYTVRKAVIRIISARQASRSERNVYLEKKLTKFSEDENK